MGPLKVIGKRGTKEPSTGRKEKNVALKGDERMG